MSPHPRPLSCERERGEGRRRAISLAIALVFTACGDNTPPPQNNGPPAPAQASSPAASVSAPAPSASAVAAPPPTASASASAATIEDAGAPPFAADNKVPPTEGPELQERAKALFEAIVANDAPKGDPFWFPKEPFIPLKDIKDPGKYWEQLHRTYAADVRSQHKKRKSWDGAEFKGFTIGSKPKWVPPGDEANKIGYYRSFHGKLRYVIDGDEKTIDVHTVITWQGRWYITHLNKFKK